MTKTSAAPALFSAYRKPDVKTVLHRAPSLNKESGPSSSPALLPPVLYHGTCGLQTLNWQKSGGIGGRSFSLSPSPIYAAIYSRYGLKQETETSIRLLNDTGRSIQFFKQDLIEKGLGNELEELKSFGPVQTLTLFDRDLLLALDNADFVKYFEPEDPGVASDYASLLIRMEGRKPIPLSALFAALDLNSDGRPGFRIFDKSLWDANFKVPPPSLERIGAFEYLAVLASQLFSE